MSLEKDIHQSRSFRNEHHKLLVNLIYTYNWVTEQLKLIIAKEDLTLQQFNILRILRGSSPKPISTLQIRDRMLDKMSDTSRLVDRLVLKGYAKKVVCKADKRLVDITITVKGMQVLKRIDKYNEKFDAVVSSINTEEANTLNSLLDKMRTTDKII